MKDKEILKANYIYRITKNWDKETADKYLSNIEEDFETWYQGYCFAIIELGEDTIPILEFANDNIKTTARIFNQTVVTLLVNLKAFIKKNKQI